MCPPLLPLVAWVCLFSHAPVAAMPLIARSNHATAPTMPNWISRHFPLAIPHKAAWTSCCPMRVSPTPPSPPDGSSRAKRDSH
ncbi:hypothetical protein QBC39DRAFT_347155 [Podospora conica]|nr:hypothetical protein QBC39DRAFT_347155 [Schizothecium conicum]